METFAFTRTGSATALLQEGWPVPTPIYKTFPNRKQRWGTYLSMFAILFARHLGTPLFLSLLLFSPPFFSSFRTLFSIFLNYKYSSIINDDEKSIFPRSRFFLRAASVPLFLLSALFSPLLDL
jgi:hypothetical protein